MTSWTKFEEWRREAGYRLILFTTKVASSYLDFRYAASDILLFGRESAGVTDAGGGGGRRAAGNPDQAADALAQCRDVGGDGDWRGAAADPRPPLKEIR